MLSFFVVTVGEILVRSMAKSMRLINEIWLEWLFIIFPPKSINSLL